LTSESFVQPIRKWIETLVIAHNLCPFAKKEFIQNRIRYCSVEAQTTAAMLEAFVAEMLYLQSNSATETSLLIFPETLSDFEDYLDFVDLCQQLLELQGFLGVFQLASFHPDYCFADVSAADPSNYTNRAPFPLLHLLREASIEKAVAHYEGAENIPNLNIQTMRRVGATKLQLLLAHCSIP
jgi:hypothetical protein